MAMVINYEKKSTSMMAQKFLCIFTLGQKMELIIIIILEKIGGKGIVNNNNNNNNCLTENDPVK